MTRLPRLLPATLLLLLSAAACSPIYVLRAGYEEAKILSRRRPIAELVADSTTPPVTREKLRLVLQARTFAQDSLGLKAGDSYTTFSRLDSDTLALIVSAAYKDRFEAYTWWFPIVGHVPYKGFFSEGAARKQMAALERKGLDTYLRPTTAFSTLGWFNDPLVSPLLRYDSVSLAETVVHELTHNTLYAPGKAMFNESLAEFVGNRGAIAFFCGRYEPRPEDCRQARANWHDQLVFGAFLDGLVARLESLYSRTDLSYEQKLQRREVIFTDAKRTFVEQVQPRFQASTYAGFLHTPLNNASLLARRLYYHRLDLFERVYDQGGGDLRTTLDRIFAAARANQKDPYAAVEQLAGSPR
ncbi:MAG TPA: aminopeptidase [Longimicrobiaceae bacterium]|nr:aminopeptidase [Longimicrobiaceae bacterium]